MSKQKKDGAKCRDEPIKKVKEKKLAKEEKAKVFWWLLYQDQNMAERVG